jgi:hypothetical protein
MKMNVKYPKIKVKLVGTDGNAFALIGRVKRALNENKVSTEEQKMFVEEATSGDYDNLLSTCCRWVDVR